MADYTLKINNEYVEEGHVAHARLELDKPAPFDIKVYYRTEEGTAKSPEDYYGTHDGYVVIPAHSLNPATIDVRTNDDHHKEYTEDFKIKIWTKDEDYGGGGAPTPSITATSTKLSGGYDYDRVKVVDGEARVEIKDNDGHDYGKAKVYVGSSEAKEGEPLKFAFWHDGDKPLHVQYYTEKWEANGHGDSDYKPTGGDFWLQPGQKYEAKVDTYLDHDKEGAERMKMWVVNTYHYDRGNEYGTGTIHDYGAPTPSFTSTASDAVFA